MRSIVLIAHNIRSTHNAGSLLRTAEGLGIQKVWLTGYTPYPAQQADDRLPHIAQTLTAQIHKTALGAEELVAWEHNESVEPVIARLKSDGFTIVALEQDKRAVPLPKFSSNSDVALIVGREVEGIEPDVLQLCDVIVEIPMTGKKESFNVVQAAAMALYHCTFINS
jgi:23S rRNA (guanosine2251-2'-O)-methyltransferase